MVVVVVYPISGIQSPLLQLSIFLRGALGFSRILRGDVAAPRWQRTSSITRQ